MAKSFAVAVHFFENGIRKKFGSFIIRMRYNISARPVCMDGHTQSRQTNLKYRKSSALSTIKFHKTYRDFNGLDVGIEIGFRLFPTFHEKENENYLMPRGLFSVSQQPNIHMNRMLVKLNLLFMRHKDYLKRLYFA